ncbi:hypothetical protein [Ponticaulis sp.]|uniref:hypothetical protein n=1 Tax=Ponticaulis sp. TaxID=2020902 RepID=UPI0026124B64|nr:hypothetical protein [Ponticaulis sp.]MDF1678944.1 hypothetical protein [Ponticaulis sp.]
MIEFTSDETTLFEGKAFFQGRVFLGTHFETFGSIDQVFGMNEYQFQWRHAVNRCVLERNISCLIASLSINNEGECSVQYYGLYPGEIVPGKEFSTSNIVATEGFMSWNTEIVTIDKDKYPVRKKIFEKLTDLYLLMRTDIDDISKFSIANSIATSIL